jgi:lipase maturation factor 1
MAAFASMAAQVDGLIGSHGILPAARFFDRARLELGLGLKTYWLLPSLLWLNTSDQALHVLCWGGLFLGAALFVGIMPGLCTVLLWLAYLSITVGGQVFLGFQWDSLLLETGLLAILMAPWKLRLDRATDQPWWFAVWLVRWLAFRLMFMSGVAKLISQDPAWRDFSALDFHYETQPLPTWTSWYIHQMPMWFQRLSVGFMFYAELAAPFLVFGTRGMRRVGFASLVLLQLLIMATGNYGFFNLLSLVLCAAILDDRDWERFRDAVRRSPRRASPLGFETTPKAPIKRWSFGRRLVVGMSGAVLIGVSAQRSLERLWPRTEAPFPLPWLADQLEPLHSANSYGLFAVMTTERPEIIIEGSTDGESWKPYHFRWKPDERNRRPRFTTPHMPRLDWQLWFAALSGDCRTQPWFIKFEQRLLTGSPEVLSLLRDNPFPDHPPRFVRARLYRYTFTHSGSPDWWNREDQGLFCPPIESRQ